MSLQWQIDFKETRVFYGPNKAGTILFSILQRETFCSCCLSLSDYTLWNLHSGDQLCEYPMESHDWVWQGALWEILVSSFSLCWHPSCYPGPVWVQHEINSTFSPLTKLRLWIRSCLIVWACVVPTPCPKMPQPSLPGDSSEEPSHDKSGGQSRLVRYKTHYNTSTVRWCLFIKIVLRWWLRGLPKGTWNQWGVPHFSTWKRICNA